MAHDTAVQRRLSAEPRTPFLQQMYCWDLLARPTSKSDLIVLIVWLFNAAVSLSPSFFLLFLEGKDIIIQPHLFNCSNWRHFKWALPFICNGHDYEIVFHAEQSSPMSTNERDVGARRAASFTHLFAGLNFYRLSRACDAVCPGSAHVTAGFELGGRLDLCNGGLE